MDEQEKKSGMMLVDAPLPPIGTDAIIGVAARASARVAAWKEIKGQALALTVPSDWVNENGKPYLQSSGAEKLRGLFEMSWTIDEPICENEPDGHYTYYYRGTFLFAGGSIQAEGSRSSRDGFFKRFRYEPVMGPDGRPVIENGRVKTKAIDLGVAAIDRRDVRMSALSNLIANGVTRVLGIRNTTWEDLERYAGIKKDDVAGVEYKKKGQAKEPAKVPTPKAKAMPDDAPAEAGQIAAMKSMAKRLGYAEKSIPEACDAKGWDGIKYNKAVALILKWNGELQELQSKKASEAPAADPKEPEPTPAELPDLEPEEGEKGDGLF